MRKFSVSAGALAVLLTATALTGCSLLSESSGKAPAEARQSSSGTSVEELRRKYTGYGFKALKTVEEQLLYADIDESANKLKSEDFFGRGFTETNRVTDILELYKDDHPEVFWIDETEPYYYTQEPNGMTLQLHFKLEGEELQKARGELDAAVKEALEDAPVDGTDYQKELYAHDRLIDNCIYDDEAVEMHKQSQVRGNEQNAYGALVEGKAVCEGYTRAFQILCDRLDVKCWVIQGKALNFGNDGKVNHIWNCVQLEDSWYYVDVTWDDYEDAPAPTDHYFYFNLTTEELVKDHEISPLYTESEDTNVWVNGYVPECTATKYNYFNLNAHPIDSAEAAGCARFVAEAAANKSASCCFLVSQDADFEAVFDEVVNGSAYDWVSGANEINGYDPQIRANCKLSNNTERRVITLILDYE